jgi:hypothetical protein
LLEKEKEGGLLELLERENEEIGTPDENTEGEESRKENRSCGSM